MPVDRILKQPETVKNNGSFSSGGTLYFQQMCSSKAEVKTIDIYTFKNRCVLLVITGEATRLTKVVNKTCNKLKSKYGGRVPQCFCREKTITKMKVPATCSRRSWSDVNVISLSPIIHRNQAFRYDLWNEAVCFLWWTLDTWDVDQVGWSCMSYYT